MRGEAASDWLNGPYFLSCMSLRLKHRTHTPLPRPVKLPCQPSQKARLQVLQYCAVGEAQFQDTPKLEMFARKVRPRWDVHGNEVTEVTEVTRPE
jgi:hypothetical protein